MRAISVWLARAGGWMRAANASSSVWSRRQAALVLGRRTLWGVSAVWAWWRRLARMASGVACSSAGRRRWIRDGSGRFERSSRRTFGRVWGAKDWSSKRGRALFPVERQTRPGPSIRHAQRVTGLGRVLTAGGGRLAASKEARKAPAVADAAWWSMAWRQAAGSVLWLSMMMPASSLERHISPTRPMISWRRGLGAGVRLEASALWW